MMLQEPGLTVVEIARAAGWSGMRQAAGSSELRRADLIESRDLRVCRVQGTKGTTSGLAANGNP